ncbi:hypothetical protein [Paenibacillus ihuae]|uniref:hypothetical protein n=1 Tax=Paenibacillus ihuae TaxID=1232431 RepID=UPI0006D53E07|nr:hypothetical protein [Paenibacillus ihuae]
MSKFVSALIVWDSNALSLKEYLKTQKVTNGYLNTSSENISMLTFKNINKKGELLAAKISRELNVRAIYLYHNEDTGWGLKGYMLGDSQGEYHIDYNSLPNNIGIDAKLQSFTGNTVEFLKLRECLESKDEQRIFEESWGLLKNTLGIDFSDDFNFDTLQGMSEGYLILSEIEPIIEKKTSLKKIVSEYLEPLMRERGFLSNNETKLPYDFAYFKEVGDFYIGLSIIKEPDQLTAHLKTLFESIPLFSVGKYYKNNIELIKVLNQIINAFDNSLENYKNDLHFEAFDSNEVLMSHMHEYMIGYDYYIVENSIGNLAGGSILYRKKHNPKEIKFLHSSYFLGITCIFQESDNIRVLDAKDENDIIINRVFRNAEGYIRLLNIYKNELKSLL